MIEVQKTYSDNPSYSVIARGAAWNSGVVLRSGLGEHQAERLAQLLRTLLAASDPCCIRGSFGEAGYLQKLM